LVFLTIAVASSFEILCASFAFTTPNVIKKATNSSMCFRFLWFINSID
jgi:hypothetical protein